MSSWWVNAAWTDFYPAQEGPVIFVDCSAVESPLDLDTRDVLSEPTVAELLPAALSLWPRGAAWGSPGNEAPGDETVIAGLTRALLSGVAELYARAWKITLESRAGTLVDSLADWEAEYGLPDPCALDVIDEARRRTNLKAKVAKLATITPEDFVRFAAGLGYVVALQEPAAFRCGQSQLGLGDQLSNVALEQQFALHILDAPTGRFQVGISQVGIDRLLDFDIGTLECAVRRVAPAWTYPVFSIAPLPAGMILMTEDDDPITTEAGSTLVVPVFS